MKTIYIIGALRNPKIPYFARDLQKLGFEAFADWHFPGPEADQFLRQDAKVRGLNYKQTLASYGAQLIFNFDVFHLTRAHLGVALFPIGPSGRMEVGFLRGQNKPVFALLDKESKRFDVMNLFFSDIFFNQKDLFTKLKNMV